MHSYSYLCIEFLIFINFLHFFWNFWNFFEFFRKTYSFLARYWGYVILPQRHKDTKFIWNKDLRSFATDGHWLRWFTQRTVSLVFSAETMLQTRLCACLPPSTTRANRSFIKLTASFNRNTPFYWCMGHEGKYNPSIYRVRKRVK